MISFSHQKQIFIPLKSAVHLISLSMTVMIFHAFSVVIDFSPLCHHSFSSQVNTCVYIIMCVCVYQSTISIYVHCVSIQIQIHNAHVHMDICMYVCVYLYTHTHVCTHVCMLYLLCYFTHGFTRLLFSLSIVLFLHFIFYTSSDFKTLSNTIC